MGRSNGRRRARRVRKAASQAGAEPGAAFAKATSGPATSVPYRAEMESAFGRDFGDVRAHVGGAAAVEGLSTLGAKAAAHGHLVAFSEASPGRELVAHELAHVVQQRGATSGVQAKPTVVSAPGDAAEGRADAAAAAVVRGEPVPDVGTAPSSHLHRVPVDTNGGTWDTTTYSAINMGAGVGKMVGAEVGLKFTPKRSGAGRHDRPRADGENAAQHRRGRPGGDR